MLIEMDLTLFCSCCCVHACVVFHSVQSVWTFSRHSPVTEFFANRHALQLVAKGLPLAVLRHTLKKYIYIYLKSFKYDLVHNHSNQIYMIKLSL